MPVVIVSFFISPLRILSRCIRVKVCKLPPQSAPDRALTLSAAKCKRRSLAGGTVTGLDRARTASAQVLPTNSGEAIDTKRSEGRPTLLVQASQSEHPVPGKPSSSMAVCHRQHTDDHPARRGTRGWRGADLQDLTGDPASSPESTANRPGYRLVAGLTKNSPETNARCSTHAAKAMRSKSEPNRRGKARTPKSLHFFS